MEETKPEIAKRNAGIIEAARIYHAEYGLECSPEQWQTDATIIDQMNFARVYGRLTDRQAAAVKTAIDENHRSDEPLPPLGVALWAEHLHDNPEFRPDLPF